MKSTVTGFQSNIIMIKKVEQIQNRYYNIALITHAFFISRQPLSCTSGLQADNNGNTGNENHKPREIRVKNSRQPRWYHILPIEQVVNKLFVSPFKWSIKYFQLLRNHSEIFLKGALLRELWNIFSDEGIY